MAQANISPLGGAVASPVIGGSAATTTVAEPAATTSPSVTISGGGDTVSASSTGRAATIPLSDSNTALEDAKGNAFAGWGMDSLSGAAVLPTYGSAPAPEFGQLGQCVDVQQQATAQADSAQAQALGSAGDPAGSNGSNSSTANLPQVYVIGDEFTSDNSTIASYLQEAEGLQGMFGGGGLSQQATDAIDKILASGDASLSQTIADGQSAVVSSDGKLLGFVDTKNDVMGDQGLGVSGHNGSVTNGLGGTIALNGQQYCVTGTTLISPIKISLTGQNVAVNSTDHEKIKMEDGKIHTMSGGLNDGEAWLVQDTGGAAAEQQGVVDGKDVFGDHMGKFINGYAQLAQQYKSELKTDANGNQYLDLTDPSSLAAKQLKLMDKSGKEIPASQVLDKIYVSYANTNLASADDKTFIKQEAQVEYRDGHTALSGDQWFSDAKTPVPATA